MAWVSGEKEQAISRFSIDTDDRLGFSGVPAPIDLVTENCREITKNLDRISR